MGKWQMTGSNPDGPEETGNVGDKPPSEQSDIVLAIQVVNSSYQAAEDQRTKHDSKALFWSRTAGIGVIVYTFLTVLITGAAIYSAHVTRRALLIGQRAFVHLEKIEFPVTEKWRADEGCCVFNVPRDEGKIIAPKFYLMNAGNTPTKHLTARIQCQPLGMGAKIDDPFDLFKMNDAKMVQRSIGAKQTIEISPDQCEIKDDDTLFNAQMHTVRRYLIGSITYEDWIEPGTMHKTRFVHELVVKELGKAGNGLVGATVTSVPVGRNNCTDDDCPE